MKGCTPKWARMARTRVGASAQSLESGFAGKGVSLRDVRAWDPSGLDVAAGREAGVEETLEQGVHAGVGAPEVVDRGNRGLAVADDEEGAVAEGGRVKSGRGLECGRVAGEFAVGAGRGRDVGREGTAERLRGESGGEEFASEPQAGSVHDGAERDRTRPPRTAVEGVNVSQPEVRGRVNGREVREQGVPGQPAVKRLEERTAEKGGREDSRAG